ncbi:MAG TPA: STAS domain-containing protein [Verrucomicrobiota bacterium]|nr:STAS domain-containing protein [Verrucomicrobiota bacterium]HNU49390.1 STAS domain-containing protein [Verrucomicrobiota bacterium]
MTDAGTRLMVAVCEGTGFFRVCGRATAKESGVFKEAAEGLRGQGLGHLVLDLSRCDSMDSTFIGVLAGLSRRLRTDAAGGGRIELVNLNPLVREQLDNLYVLELFLLTESAAAPGVGYDRLTARPTDKAELCRLMLDAHQTLMAVNPANIPRFRQVTEYLEQDLRRSGPDSARGANQGPTGGEP